ncbi:hypothetical protein VCHC50A2_1839, partial [Vibrio cholerae HC-50A2]
MSLAKALVAIRSNNATQLQRGFIAYLHFLVI